MKAVVLPAIGDSSQFRVAEIPEPVPGPRQVRIRVAAAGFNPADCKMRAGAIDPGPLPCILGGEVAGVVDRLGADAGGFSIGDRVCAYLPITRGGYAEYVCTDEAFVAKMPAWLSFAEGACIPIAGLTALACVEEAARRQPRAVLLVGASGGVGSFVASMLAHSVLDVLTLTAGSTSSADYLARRLGSGRGRIVRYDGLDGAAFSRALGAETKDGRYDVVIDLVGGVTQSLSAEVLEFDGSLISIVHPPNQDVLALLAARSAGFRFVSLKARARGPARAWLEYTRMFAALMARLEAGTAGLPDVSVVGELRSETVAEAHRRIEGRQVQGKLAMLCGAWPDPGVSP